ncbi:MAG: hypothetical protein CMN25_17845 [Salinicola sp.]|nr:hypothetical protein [Salinicola sp.]
MALTNAASQVDQILYERLKAHFSDAELVEFGMIMAILTGMAKFILAFDLLERLRICPFTAGGKPAE